jgi:hypothetical protein
LPVPTPPAPAERFATLLLRLSHAVAARSGGGLLSFALIALIVTRIRTIKQLFAGLAARIQAGTYQPRRFAPRRTAPGRPPPVDKLPKTFGWLLPLVPDAAAFGAQLQALLGDPEMAALIAAAPEAMRRPLRSLCRMLAVLPPPILARPKPPAPASPSPLAQNGRGGKSRPVPDRPATTPFRGKPSRPAAPPARKTG